MLQNTSVFQIAGMHQFANNKPIFKIAIKNFTKSGVENYYMKRTTVLHHLLYMIISFWHVREFAHRFSEQIARFLLKNERMSDSLKKTSDSLICSFLVTDLSNSLTIAHFLWVTWANRSWPLIFGERPERFAHITHQKRGNERIANFFI